jgi:SulP family sulfate permease
MVPSDPTKLLRPSAALRDSIIQGYGAAKFRSDLLAGLVVGLVALPLSMALAIAVEIPPQHGLYTAIVAGFVIAVLGGSRTQVSGPTAAFVVILIPIVHKFGLGGLLLSTMMAGFILVVMAIARLGRLIQYIPYPVTAGFTAGIAVVIATLQVRDFLGLTVTAMPESYLERVVVLFRALPTFRWQDLVCGLGTLAILIAWPRFNRKIPAPLIALAVAGAAAWLLGDNGPLTIHDRFAGIPQSPPLPLLPWTLPGANGAPLVITLDLIEELFPSAFAIAMLGAIESLLSAVIADGMVGSRHDPNAELMGQGVGNLIAPFFGGFAATGAIARTATNIRAGAQTPVAAMVHSLFVLTAVLALAPLLGHLPMAALAALLMIVAWNMSEVKHILRNIKIAPRNDTAVLLACFVLTIVFDMVVAVMTGIALAGLLFMKRMSELSGAKIIRGKEPGIHEPLPADVILYDIEGPLFFGAAQKAMSELDRIATITRVVILDLEDVPTIDATGIVNFQSALKRLNDSRIVVILVGLKGHARQVLQRAGVLETAQLMMCPKRELAIELAKQYSRGDKPRGQTSVFRKVEA